VADILTWLQAADIPVTEYSKWRTRTSAGGFDPVGVMVHHTASKDSSVRTMVFGHSRLSGPLSHLFIEQIPAPKVWLISQGNANHAGQGSPIQLERVKQDHLPFPVPPPLPSSDHITGNPWFWGIEIEGPEILPESYRLAVRCVAAILQGNGWSVAHVISHKEWTFPRKVDPAFSMTTFRKDVTTEMGASMYPPQTRNDMRRDLADPQGVPRWSPWDEYVEAGGTSIPESGPWPAQRYDLAWYWKRFVKPLEEENDELRLDLTNLHAHVEQIDTEFAALTERVALLEAHIVDRPGDGITFGQAVTFQPIGGP